MLTQDDLMAIATLMEKTIDQKLEPIKERLDGVDKRLDGMGEQLKELEPIKERLDGMDEQLKVLDKKNTDTRSVIETQEYEIGRASCRERV